MLVHRNARAEFQRRHIDNRQRPEAFARAQTANGKGTIFKQLAAMGTHDIHYLLLL